MAASTSANPTSPRVIAKTRFVHQLQTRNNIPLLSIQEEEDGREATPPQQVQEHDSGADNDPIPHYVKDVQEMLRAKSKMKPVGPVIMNVGRRSKTTERRVNGLLTGRMRNNAKRASKKRPQQLIDE